MENEPQLESMNVEEIKDQLLTITEETPKSELIQKIDFLVKQLNLAYDTGRRNNLLLLEALERAQTLYKKYEDSKKSLGYRLKLFVKKVLIGWGWYEASYDELKELHFGGVLGKTRDDISSK